MSRSFKKHFILKDTSQYGKHQANKKVRRAKDVPSGKAYKKVFNPYDVTEWIQYHLRGTKIWTTKMYRK